ncbi:hypothetical protein BLA24_07930 [Streptomyces cinnamoneus]|uniref:Tyr recombinase domain-containing protein n=1 Tax=Streptomyces cinnamoneus TaxID=53446 RepID=A0A2G1XLC9_STRCJ|nr:hypothetical protein BLA24_10405 [Streptomyces cinnamoneus]PHQ51982.1 hypothetical protein BLA24_10420 [Streptomyces cinnamoneus]PHQ52370.1 hypothetical protein BLA24_07930 [Streptomyces cinnamoneus]
MSLTARSFGWPGGCASRKGWGEQLALNEVIEAAQRTDACGELLGYQPHDFRRMFITDAIMNGLPPHIAQVIAGHDDINTTMHYNAVYPSAAIAAHHAFVARRRNLRPGEEYRVPTSEEWEAFLGRFGRRKLSLGPCGRSFGSECVHEHACVRCPVLVVGSEDRGRLDEIRQNLLDRIVEAQVEGWLGEVEGLSYWRTNLTMRQLAPLFGISKSVADRIIDQLGPLIAFQPRRRFAKDTVLVVDGTLGYVGEFRERVSVSAVNASGCGVRVPVSFGSTGGLAVGAWACSVLRGGVDGAEVQGRAVRGGPQGLPCRGVEACRDAQVRRRPPDGAERFGVGLAPAAQEAAAAADPPGPVQTGDRPDAAGGSGHPAQAAAYREACLRPAP